MSDRMRGRWAVAAAGVVVAGALAIAGWADEAGSPVPEKVAEHPLLGALSEMPEAAGDVASRGEPDGGITIDYPLEGSVFPPDFASPTFVWHDAKEKPDTWLVEVRFAEGEPLRVLVRGEPPAPGEIDPDCLGATNEVYRPTPYQASARTWTPSPAVWEDVKRRSVAAPARLTIRGIDSREAGVALSWVSVTLSTSKDPVGAPIFYRDVPLMPGRGQNGLITPLVPSAIPLIAWRLKDVSRKDSRVLLRSMPTCANCHSFSDDGKTIGIDVDGPTGDKGAYALTRLQAETTIRSQDVITWNSFPGKPKDHRTIGFLSRVSPDGSFVVSTVNEALYVSNFLEYRFLQVFFPTRGILAWYRRDTGEMKALPGADDPAYVHCDAVWTPDGKTLVFARAGAKDPYEAGKPLATHPNDPNETQIQYDLYRIPFDEGKGGKAEPIAGASRNGMSNTFPKVTPDGRWVVFVQCRNGQLLRPDGRLWIVPLAGGEAREMTCNTPLMNSWHSFSPNGRWMVFTSKTNTPYTQMFLTHLDGEGRDSPAILIPGTTAANRAVNLPEFVNTAYEALRSIDVPAVNHYRDLQRGVDALEKGGYDEAIRHFEKALEQDPDFSRAYLNLGNVLADRGRVDDAIRHYEHALELNPELPLAHVNLGFVLELQGKRDLAREHYERALAIDADHPLAHNNLGYLLFDAGRTEEAVEHYRHALRWEPDLVLARKNLARAHERAGRLDEALEEFGRAFARAPKDPVVLAGLARLRLRRGEHAAARAHLERWVEADPENVDARAELVWLLSTSPEEAVRDGERALAMATELTAGSGRRRPKPLQALAAAYAEVGRFDEAVAAQSEAILLVPEDQATLAAQAREVLEVYRKGKPFRTPAPAAAPNPPPR